MKSEASNEPVVKKQKRLVENKFPIKKNCLMCGYICDLIPDPKNPKRWRDSCESRTADRGAGRKSFKEVLLLMVSTFVYYL